MYPRRNLKPNSGQGAKRYTLSQVGADTTRHCLVIQTLPPISTVTNTCASGRYPLGYSLTQPPTGPKTSIDNHTKPNRRRVDKHPRLVTTASRRLQWACKQSGDRRRLEHLMDAACDCSHTNHTLLNHAILTDISDENYGCLRLF